MLPMHADWLVQELLEMSGGDLISHHRTTGLQTCAAVSSFIWVLGAQTQVLILVCQAKAISPLQVHFQNPFLEVEFTCHVTHQLTAQFQDSTQDRCPVS